MDRREQAKQQQKHQMQMQRLSQNDNDSPQTPLFGVPKKVSHRRKLNFLNIFNGKWTDCVISYDDWVCHTRRSKFLCINHQNDYDAIESLDRNHEIFLDII